MAKKMLNAYKIAGNTFAAVELEKYFKPGPCPIDKETDYCDGDFTVKTLSDEEYNSEIKGDTKNTLSLDGTWKLSTPAVEGKDAISIDATVPGSIHTALWQGGIMDDPYKGRNDSIAHEFSTTRDWDYEKEFEYSGHGAATLVFDGVCDRSTFELNGILLGYHQGMFGGPEYDITPFVREGKNILHVHLERATHYTQTVVFNCSDGWHYAKIWPLGVWNHVRIINPEEGAFEKPFVTTLDSLRGTVCVTTDFTSPSKLATASDYDIKVIVKPDNFKGKAFEFTVPGLNKTKIEFSVPDFKLWWPNGFGEQNLYKMTLQTVRKSDGIVVAERNTTFGIRTLEMMSYPSGETTEMYNRMLVFNRKGVFMKGAGWCTIDALMRFDRGMYDRILSRAKQQGVNFLRAWGGGLTETDEFYDICDRYGICVYQEWPCCWDSSKMQPREELLETIRYNTIRIRNHASLAVYGGGNEGYGAVDDDNLNEIGRLTYENDGTRIFWRQDGGIGGRGMVHDHIHWGGETPEHYMSVYGYKNEKNLHEYGQDATMNISSIKRFSTPGELMEWPLDPQGTVAHHMQTFNGHNNWSPSPHGHDVENCIYCAKFFLEPDNLAAMSLGSQLYQAMSKVPAIVNARINWPRTTANIYYKLSDIYPGGSWAVVDWYGAPKIAHYLCQDAQASIMCCGHLDRYNTYDKDEKDLSVPVYVLDDTGVIGNKEARAVVQYLDENLKVIAEKSFECKAVTAGSNFQGVFHITEEQLGKGAGILVFTMYIEGKQVSRYYMPVNFDKDRGSLFRFPRTQINVRKVNNVSTDAECASVKEQYYEISSAFDGSLYGTDNKAILVTNNSDVPAIGVHPVFSSGEQEAKTVCSDSYFMLMPGESKVIYVSDYSGIEKIRTWNDEYFTDELQVVKRSCSLPKTDMNIIALSETSSSFKLTWNCDYPEIAGFTVYIDGKRFADVSAKTARKGLVYSYVCENIEEATTHEVTITAINNQLHEFVISEKVAADVLPDLETPRTICAFLPASNKIRVTFSKKMNKDELKNILNYTVPGEKITDAAVSEEGNIVTLSLASDRDYSGKMLSVSNIHDITKSKNLISSESINILGTITGKDFVNDGTRTVITDTWYSLTENANIHFTVTPVKDNGWYRVLLAKCKKGTPGHFEFYLRPDNTLYLYSLKGDWDLGTVIKCGETARIDAVMNNGGLDIYRDGKLVRKETPVDTKEIQGDITIGSLTELGLEFTGKMDNVELKTY